MHVVDSVPTARGRKAPLKKVPWEIWVLRPFFCCCCWSVETFKLKWIPCVFKFRPLPNLACPNLQLLPISPILLWRHENHFSGTSCIPGSCRRCSIAKMWSKTWHWVNCSRAQMAPRYTGWKQPCSECNGNWHRTEPGDAEALCPYRSGIPRASSSLPTWSKAFPLTPVSFSVSFILCVFQYFCFLQLIWWGVTVRGRARDAEGAGGAKEKTDFHHEEQALEDDEEALGAQVPIKMGTPTPGVSADFCQMHFAFPWNDIFAAAVIP